MILIGNKDYKVAVCVNRKLNKIQNFKLTYCGGSQVDKDGHHVAGGVWCSRQKDHRVRVTFFNLNVQGISEI